MKGYDWQEFITSDTVAYFRRFPVERIRRNTLQFESVVVLVNHVGVWLYPPEKANTFIAEQGSELIVLKAASVTIERLTPFVSPASAANIVAMYGRCQSARGEIQTAWRFYRLYNSELVLARDLSFIDSLHHRARLTAVLVHRNGVSIHQGALQDGRAPHESDCIMFIPARALSPEILRRHFSLVVAAEIMAIFRMNRDQLLHCLRGGKP
ncbi:hypothetical protein [Geomonas ferrireducens]|uniref:hypothetical protein n=1 Tax=Geomonas ferrireducens TaxID=2570227 RepID=UPI0010A78543|nr:hypothetical protein [Geomonas ferrireducens]